MHYAEPSPDLNENTFISPHALARAYGFFGGRDMSRVPSVIPVSVKKTLILQEPFPWNIAATTPPQPLI